MEGGATCFSSYTYHEVQEEREKMRKELKGKNEPAFDNLENYQLTQIANDPKIRRFNQKTCYGGTAKPK